MLVTPTIQELSERPSPLEVWQALAYCGVCGVTVVLQTHIFEAPMTALPSPLRTDGKRIIMGSLYFRDPFHNTTLPFENYCSAACSTRRGNDL